MSAEAIFSMDEANDLSIPISIRRDTAAVDMTGYTIKLVVASGKGEIPVFLKSTTDASIVPGTDLTVAPQFFAVINKADTSGKAGVYSFEVQAIDPAGKQVTELHGSWYINQRILT